MRYEHEGHRQRLADKVLKGACCEHEYLEMLLCYAIPRRNTNDLAHRLLAEFGGVQQILSATPEQLQSVEGIGKSAAAFIKCLHKLCEDYVKLSTIGGSFPETYERAAFAAFVKEFYQGEAFEVFDVYLIDDGGKLFRRKRFSLGQNGRVQIPVEELGTLLAEARPSGIVVVHNHTVGSSTPSERDDQATKSCQYICNMHGVLFCNHYIYAKDGVYDYYNSGKLQTLSNDWSMSKLVGVE